MDGLIGTDEVRGHSAQLTTPLLGSSGETSRE